MGLGYLNCAPIEWRGVDHKMGHYTDSKYVGFLSICNYNFYYKLQKNSFKVAHVQVSRYAADCLP